MLIGNWDVESANARQHRVTYGSCSIDNESDWVRGSPFPVVLKNEIGFKEIEILLILRENKEDATTDISTILSHLLEPAELTLDNNDHRFYGILKKYSVKEVVQEHWHNLTLTFDCYEYAREAVRTYSGETEFSINNPGNIITPVVVEITPQMALISLVITGLCRDAAGTDLPITVKSLEKSKTVVIDGETGLVTQDGALKAADVEFWAVPTLLPKSNTITVSSNLVDITLRYRPRFM